MGTNEPFDAWVYQQIFEAAGDAMLLLDTQVILAANQHAARLFGFGAPAELVGRSPSSLSPSHQQLHGLGTAEAVRQRMCGALGGAPQRYAWTHIRADGTTFPAEVTLTRLPRPSPDRDAAPDGRELLLAVVRDMTEQREVEDELRHREELFQLVMDNMPAAMTITDHEGHVLFSNQLAREAGATTVPWNVAGSVELERFPHTIAEMHQRDDALAFAEGAHTRRWTLPLPNDLEHHLVTSRFTFTDRAGDVRLATVTRDVTDEVAAQERFRLIFDRAENAIVLLDAETRKIVETNQKFRDLLGYTAEQLDEAGSELLRVPGYDPTNERATMREVLSGERARATIAKPLRAADGRRLEVRLNVSLIRVGNRPFMLGIIEDVTELLSLNAQLLQAQKLEAVGRLAGGVAHDFNNLLTVILTNSELAEAMLGDLGPDAEEVRELLAEVVRATRLAGGITRQLLLFSRTSIARHETVDLSELVEQVRKVVDRLLPSNIVKQFHLSPAGCQAKTDPTHVQQVVLNLAVNAADAMPEGGNLTIETERREVQGGSCALCGKHVEGTYCVIRVEDTGVGMSPDVQRRAFEPFFTTKAVGKGTGLGLSTVAAIVAQAGGHLLLRSEEGQGAAFEVLFPAQVTVDEVVAPDVGPVGRANLAGSIVLVEDNAMLLRMEQRMLERVGMKVHGFSDASEALSFLTDHRGEVDLVLSDYMMRGMNGLELQAKLRERFPDLPFLLTSGYAGTTDIAERVQRLGIGFLSKPYSMGELLEKIRPKLDSA